jgi:hypothetical protein
MLPILRVIPVGGVLLAIAILILALNPPSDPRGHLTGAGGALIAREQHPEWPQFLLLAAARRAVELSRLRELPDTTVRSVPPAAPPQAERPPAVAAVPAGRNDADPEDVTGTIVQSPGAAMPVEIGETSSAELPVIPHEERPPVIMMPERAKPPGESNAAPEQAKPQPANAITTPQPVKPRRARRAKPAPAKQQASAQVNFFEALFGNSSQPSANAKRTITPVQPAQ